MTENNQNDDQEKELRNKLLKRLGIAALMVLVLLAILAFFDHLSSRRVDEPAPKVFTKPVPVPPKKEVTQAVKPALSETTVPETPSTAPPALSQVQVPPALSSPQSEVPPAKEMPAPVKEQTAPVKEAPPPVKTVSTVPEKTAPAPVRPTSVKTPPPPAKTPETKPVPEATAAPVVETPTKTTKPPESPTHAKEETVVTMPANSLPRVITGFLVQAGVFTNARKAEELHAKLALNGIPSTLEARVQIGPFKTKEEAEAAKKKLKELGIDGLLIPPSGRR